MMQLAEIERQHIQPLTRAEKEQLIKDIQRMLDEEDLREMGFVPGAVFPVESPGAIADDTDYEAAATLQRYIEEHEHEI